MASFLFPKDELTALAIRMKKGDRRAAAELFDELLPKAHGFFFARTGHRETAEDLSQDLFMKLVEKVEMFDESKGHFVTWFWQMARNMLIDHYRAKKETTFSAYPEETVEAFAVGTMPDLDPRLGYQKVRIVLDTLSVDEQELFEHRFVMQMSYREMAAILKKSEVALRVATMRIKQKIKEGLKHDI